LVISARCVWLAVGDSEYKEQISKLKARVSQRAQRGVILDNKGTLLAVNKLKEDVYVDAKVLLQPYENEVPEHYTQRFETIAKLESLLGLAPCTIEKLIFETPPEKNRHIVVARGITPEQKFEFDTLFTYRYFEERPDGSEPVEKERAPERLYGTGIDQRWVREYPMGSLFSHVVGYAGQLKAGSEGLEREYFDILKEKKGEKVFVVDSGRRPLNELEKEVQPENGKSLLLTLDSVLQMYTRDALVERCKLYKAESGFAIVMNPYSGAVLALSSYPEYDAGNLSESTPSARRNRAITDLFEPGSVVKPLIMAGAIDTGVINKNTVIDCENGLFVKHGYGRIQEYNYHRYGMLPLKEIIVNSSNIGMAKIGIALGNKRLYDVLDTIGFSYRTDIDYPGERYPRIADPARWTGYSITRIPYGQEIGLTGIQVARGYCVLANGGRSVRPFMVQAIVDSDAKSVKDVSDTGERYGMVFTPDTAGFMMKCLTDVVNSDHGTGKTAALKDYTVFGKTGTANIWDNDIKQYSSKYYTASFVGGAPASNPALIVMVSISKPDKSLGMGYSGGRVTAPAVKKILEQSLAYLNVPPDRSGD
jgi:cell division protein FtsI (penicillin-binding protein 3)